MLRRAGPADLVAYGRLCRETFVATFRDSHDADSMARHVEWAFNDDRVGAELTDASRTVIVATAGDDLIGYVLLRSGDAPPAVHAARPVEIGRFYVASAWHGRGVADALMDAAIAEARQRNADVAWLAAWQENPRALRFYARRGFVIVGSATYQFDGQLEHDHLLTLTL
jgi:diamine N-acetyltransferase